MIPGGFVPTDIAGCLLWLDASQIVGLNDGDPVSTWADESGNGNDVTQSNAQEKPTYQTNELNGLPVVNFTPTGGGGTKEFLRRTFSSPLAQPGTVFVVVRSQSTTDSGKIFDGVGSGRWLIQPSGGTWQIFAGSTVLSGGTADTNWHVFSLIFNGASSEVFVDGVSTITGNPGAANFDGITLGGDNGSGTSPLTGDEAEVIIYNSALGTTDRQTVEAYLASKYAL